MTPFKYYRANTLDDAGTDVGDDARFLAGGTSLVDLMKLGVETPKTLIDLNRVGDLRGIDESDGLGIRIGAITRMSELAGYPGLEQRLPVLYQGLLAGATPQLRNMATVAGNSLQRTRCIYFRDPSFPSCNKRVPHSGCGAQNGVNDEHAILGWTEACVAVHPSDLAVALLALDTEIVTARRTIPLLALHRLPGDDPAHDVTLQSGELIVALYVPNTMRARHSAYAKAPVGGFALASAGVALELNAAGRIASARIAVGGVAHAPWRAETAEAIVVGKAPDHTAFEDAAQSAFEEARSLAMNGYKIPLARAVLVEALVKAVQS